MINIPNTETYRISSAILYKRHWLSASCPLIWREAARQRAATSCVAEGAAPLEGILLNNGSLSPARNCFCWLCKRRAAACPGEAVHCYVFVQSAGPMHGCSRWWILQATHDGPLHLWSKKTIPQSKFSLLWVLLILGFAILKGYRFPQEKMLFVWNDFIDMKWQYITLHSVQPSLPFILCWTTSHPCTSDTPGTAALGGPHHGQLAGPKASEVLPRREDLPRGRGPAEPAQGLASTLKTAAGDPAMSVFGDGEASPPVCCWLGTKSPHTASSRW